MRPLQVLNTQPNRCERILDLMGDLSCQLAPRQNPDRPGQLSGIIESQDTPARHAMNASHLSADLSGSDGELAGVGLGFPAEEPPHPPPHWRPMRAA